MPIPTVLELIHARLKDKSSTPGHRNDPYKLAVVAEDGSMKWVVAGGMVARLEAHGILPDFIVGTSGGGLASCFYAAGHARHGCTSLLYLNKKGFNRDNKSRRFIDATRLLRNQPVMDINGMIDTVFTERVPLNFANLTLGGIPIYLMATTRQGESIAQPLHGQSTAVIKLAMKNTARVPFIAHNVKDTSVVWDGGLSASLPVAQALSLGATHVLVVRCKSEPVLKISPIETYLVRPALRRYAPDLLHLVNQRPAYYTQVLGLLAQNQPHIFTLALPHVRIGIAESNEGKLFRQLVEAWCHTGAALGLPEQKLPAEWQPEAALYL